MPAASRATPTISGQLEREVRDSKVKGGRSDGPGDARGTRGVLGLGRGAPWLWLSRPVQHRDALPAVRDRARDLYPFRRRREVFWPSLAALAGFVLSFLLGFLLLAPLGCTATAVAPSAGAGASNVTCTTVLGHVFGLRYAGTGSYSPSLLAATLVALGLGLVVGVGLPWGSKTLIRRLRVARARFNPRGHRPRAETHPYPRQRCAARSNTTPATS